jgi:hypothetical protein
MKFIDKKGPFPTKLAQWKYYHHKELYGFYINSVVKGSTIWKYLDNHKEFLQGLFHPQLIECLEIHSWTLLLKGKFEY